ncbi:MAG: 6-carboxytetrahydropterin synthase [Pseudomonadota bacterium]
MTERSESEFSLSVRDHIMIAHSFRGALFGPAQRLHGATFIVTATFMAPQLDEHHLVIDIGYARELLREVLAPLDYQNLDELAAFDGLNTTTEFLCQYIHGQVAQKLGTEPGSNAVHRLRIELGESHVAWASFVAPVRGG